MPLQQQMTGWKIGWRKILYDSSIVIHNDCMLRDRDHVFKNKTITVKIDIVQDVHKTGTLDFHKTTCI